MIYTFTNIDEIKDILIQCKITDLSDYNKFYYPSLNKFIKCPLCNGKQSIIVDYIKNIPEYNLFSFDANFKCLNNCYFQLYFYISFKENKLFINEFGIIFSFRIDTFNAYHIEYKNNVYYNQYNDKTINTAKSYLDSIIFTKKYLENILFE